MWLGLVRGLTLALVVVAWAGASNAAPYAAVVMDARTGEIVHSTDGDKRLHPASLTKMMTLYIVFSEIRAGRLSLDQKVRISRNAASKPPSKLGLKEGQTIALRYLIRAAAVKSANDAAAALGEAVSGSESAFAQRMTATALAMGLRNTQFRNASGLTQSGHFSSPHDMAEIGRRLFYDFPQYYNLFSRRSTSAGVATVYNTNRRLLDAYPGADGIKTGYTSAAGYNLVASAERGSERVIVAVFGGSSTARRNATVMELMDLGFKKMPRYAQVVKPPPLDYASISVPGTRASAGTQVASATGRQLARSRRPMVRQVAEDIVIARAVSDVTEARALATGQDDDSQGLATPGQGGAIAAAVAAAIADGEPMVAAVMPRPRPAGRRTVRTASAGDVQRMPPEVKSVPAESGNWGVRIGAYPTRDQAERKLLTVALQDLEAFESGLRVIQPAVRKGAPVFEARFVGLSRAEAENACARLIARQGECETLRP